MIAQLKSDLEKTYDHLSHWAFYPCCDGDTKIINTLREYSKNGISTFVLCDSISDNQFKNNDKNAFFWEGICKVENSGFYIESDVNLPEEYLRKNKNWGTNEIETELTKEFGNDYSNYIQNITPYIQRVTLENEKNLIVYIIKYEPISALMMIYNLLERKMGSWCLIYEAPRLAWNGNKFFAREIGYLCNNINLSDSDSFFIFSRTQIKEDMPWEVIEEVDGTMEVTDDTGELVETTIGRLYFFSRPIFYKYEACIKNLKMAWRLRLNIESGLL